jgi:hypothetical protein
MVDESTLREKARQLIQSGKLPARRPERMWGGRSTGDRCAICDHPADPDQFEFELQFGADGALPALNTCHVHIRCFAAWEFEREGFEVSNGNGVLRAARRDDNIVDRERDGTPKRGSA